MCVCVPEMTVSKIGILSTLFSFENNAKKTKQSSHILLRVIRLDGRLLEDRRNYLRPVAFFHQYKKGISKLCAKYLKNGLDEILRPGLKPHQ